ncbi:MAG: hypothetical protein ACI9XR_001231 [Flavobacterium sp.]|jgi:hypothetical protein
MLPKEIFHLFLMGTISMSVFNPFLEKIGTGLNVLIQ